MKSTFTVLGLVLVLLAGAAAGYFLASNKPQTGPGVTPTPAVENMIIVDSPKSGTLVTSPLKVTGRARGNWYFEASFPVELKDMNGQALALVPAQAQGEWMTTDWVPFEVTLVFSVTATTTDNGILTLHKDNPSGEPQFDDARSISVRLK
jgi:hypothetical protein